jgi:DNA-binding response OmpR family regulator
MPGVDRRAEAQHLIPRLAYVEDSDHDALMFETAVERRSLAAEVVRVASVAAAERFVAYLASGDEPLPALVFVDVDLPDGSGHSVVAALRRRFDEATLPVVVFSGSDDPGDIDRAYDAGANCYLIKPLAFGEYARRVAGACRFAATTTGGERRPAPEGR